MAFAFQTVPQIVVEAGAAARLGEFVSERGSRRALLVTDPGLVRLGLHLPALDSLGKSLEAVAVFSDVGADPTDAMARAATAAARAIEADTVIGFGGGSSMDIAKVAAFMAGQDSQALEAIYGVGQAVGSRQRELIQVPTTAGTGSEVTPISILTTGETTKSGIVSPQLYADLAILDAELTLGLPPAVTAATGVDAMVHAIEAYTSRYKKNPVSDALAREALRLLHTNLPLAVRDGRNLRAREACLLGAMLAGQAFANAPVAAVHALAYPLGGHFHIPHGLSNALVLMPVLRFNSVAPEAKAAYAELSALLGGPPSADGLCATMAALCEAVGMAQRLRDHGISHNQIPMLAADAMKQTRLLQNNPREVSEADAREIYDAVW